MITKRIMLGVLTLALLLVGTLAPAGAHGTQESKTYEAFLPYAESCENGECSIAGCDNCSIFGIWLGRVWFTADAGEVAFTAEDEVAGSVVGIHVRYYAEGDGYIAGPDGTPYQDELCTPTATLALPPGATSVAVSFGSLDCADGPATAGTLTAHWTG